MRMPPHVHDYVRSIFEQANQRIAEKITRIPTTHETSLDMTLIESISQFAVSHEVTPNWTVHLDTHYLGGGRHFGQWEVADIGFIVVWRVRGVVRLRKVAILQSKRLYPNEQTIEEDTALDYMIGYGRLMQGDDVELAAQQERLFSFTNDSKLRALVVGDGQYRAIAEYERQNGIPVHYLFYQPLAIPWQQQIPIRAPLRAFPQRQVGVEVARASDLRLLLKGRRHPFSPARRDVVALRRWPLQRFVADELLRCREGYRTGSPNDVGLLQVFNRRSGPISTAIAITIDRT